jgi:hypothetical protein
MTATTAMAVAVSSTLPAPAVAGSSQAVVVEILFVVYDNIICIS